MHKFTYSLFFLCGLLLLLTACGPATPSANMIATAIAETQAAVTASATMTPLPPSPTPAPCISEVFGQELTDVLARFNDAATLADSTPRMQLATGIADLQSIRRDAENLAFPVCALDAKVPLIAYMDATITGFTEFLAENEYDKYFETARIQRGTFQASYDQVLKKDQLMLGKIVPLADAVLILTPLNPDGHTFYFRLENSAERPVWYLNIIFQYPNEDGTLWTLGSQYVSFLTPGQIIEIGIPRTSETVSKDVDYTRIMFNVEEGYISP